MKGVSRLWLWQDGHCINRPRGPAGGGAAQHRDGVQHRLGRLSHRLGPPTVMQSGPFPVCCPRRRRQPGVGLPCCPVHPQVGGLPAEFQGVRHAAALLHAAAGHPVRQDPHGAGRTREPGGPGVRAGLHHEDQAGGAAGAGAGAGAETGQFASRGRCALVQTLALLPMPQLALAVCHGARAPSDPGWRLASWQPRPGSTTAAPPGRRAPGLSHGVAVMRAVRGSAHRVPGSLRVGRRACFRWLCSPFGTEKTLSWGLSFLGLGWWGRAGDSVASSALAIPGDEHSTAELYTRCDGPSSAGRTACVQGLPAAGPHVPPWLMLSLGLQESGPALQCRPLLMAQVPGRWPL